jgi:hypothetical protein
LIPIPHRQHIDMVLNQKAPVDIRILVRTHRHHRQFRHPPLQRKQARKLLDARSAKSRPEVKHNHTPSQLIQVHSSALIAKHKLRRRLIDVSGMTSPVASSYQQRS